MLIAEEGLGTRLTASGAPRGIYCGMGVCFDCLVVVDGVPNTRACTTLVADGMRIERQVGLGLNTEPLAGPALRSWPVRPRRRVRPKRTVLKTVTDKPAPTGLQGEDNERAPASK